MQAIATPPPQGTSRTRGPRRAPAAADHLGRSAGWLATAAGVIYLVGSLVDFGILWLLQRQDTLQWEFVALVQTAEGFPRLVLGAALILAGSSLRGVPARWTHRAIGALVVLLALGAAAIGALAGLNYLSMAGSLQGEAGGLFRSASVKTVALSALYVCVLLPAGIAGLRVGRSRSPA